MDVGEPLSVQRLSEEVWQRERRSFETAMRAKIDGVRARRRREGKDPVHDFLFEYYSFSPASLSRWSPGVGVFLEGPSAQREFCGKKGWKVEDGGARLDPAAIPEERVDALRWIVELLAASEARPPFFGCAGMHEWAMVYRCEAVRHAVPLRLSPDAIAAHVESQPIACSHHDAFRFFTEAARPLNRLQPSAATMAEFEQPGCLHTNMDLYRWAYKFYPWIPSALIAQAFDLAIEARQLDMEASPYDLRAAGLSAIPMETPEGRWTYQQRQKAIWQAGVPLRAALLAAYRRLWGLKVT